MEHILSPKARDEILRFPSHAADDHERAVICAARLQPFERVEQHSQIFSWFDRADEENVTIRKSRVPGPGSRDIDA